MTILLRTTPCLTLGLAAVALSACSSLHLELGSVVVTRDATTCPGQSLSFLLSEDGHFTEEVVLAPGASSGKRPDNPGSHVYTAEIRNSTMQVKPVTATVLENQTLNVLMTCTGA